VDFISVPLSDAQLQALGGRWVGAKADADDAESAPLSGAQRGAEDGELLAPTRTLKLPESTQGLSASLAGDASMLAVGCHDGSVLVVSAADLGVVTSVAAGAEGSVACLKWRPDGPFSAMQNVLLVAQGEAVSHLHASTGRVLRRTRSPGSNTLVLAPRPDGSGFAAAGTDRVVRVYDEATGKPTASLDSGDGVDTSGHSNSVYGLAWSDQDPQARAAAATAPGCSTPHAARRSRRPPPLPSQYSFRRRRLKNTTHETTTPTRADRSWCRAAGTSACLCGTCGRGTRCAPSSGPTCAATRWTCGAGGC
jgi:hypothetical protein